MNLEDLEWKEFKIGEIFKLEDREQKQVPTGAYIKKEYLRKGSVPRITVTSTNNGIDDFWETEHKNNRCFENFISVSFLGNAFYHKYKASLDMKVHVLQLKDTKLNKYIANFLITAIKNNTKDSSYGNQLSSTDLPRKSILLPINNQGNPDYVVMEELGKKKERELIDEYVTFAKVALQQINITSLVPLEEKQWKPFMINKIFTVLSGKRLESYNMTLGERPFIGATDSENGITNYVSNKNESLDKNVLGVNYNGNGMAISFYHQYECLFSDDVKRFHLKEYPDNKYVLLFFKAIILQQKPKYNYGYKFNGTRMKRQIIMLPANDAGNPDYEYMEQYIKNLMIKKYKAYLEYVEK